MSYFSRVYINITCSSTFRYEIIERRKFPFVTRDFFQPMNYAKRNKMKKLSAKKLLLECQDTLIRSCCLLLSINPSGLKSGFSNSHVNAVSKTYFIEVCLLLAQLTAQLRLCCQCSRV